LFPASIEIVLIEIPLIETLFVMLRRAARLIVVVVDDCFFHRPLETGAHARAAETAKTRLTPSIAGMPHDAVQRCFDALKCQCACGHPGCGLHCAAQKARLPTLYRHVLRLHDLLILRLINGLRILLHRLEWRPLIVACLWVARLNWHR